MQKTHILLFCTFLLNNNNNFIWKRDITHEHKRETQVKENKKKPLHKAHNLAVLREQNLQVGEGKMRRTEVLHCVSDEL